MRIARGTTVVAKCARVVPAGLIGALALVLVVESHVARHESDFTNFSATDWRLTARAATRQATDAPILCFGDSLLKFGLAPEVLERRLGARVYNLSVLGGQSVSSYFLFRRAIEAGARPRAVVLDCHDPPLLAGEIKRGNSLRDHIRNWPDALDTREAIEMAWSARDATLLGQIVLAQALPTIKARHEIRKNVLDALGNIPNGVGNFARIERRNLLANRGSILMPPARGATPSPAEALRNSPMCSWVSDPVTTEYLDRFLRLAASRGIRVYWVLPPMSPEQETLRSRNGHRDSLVALSRELQTRYPSLIVIDGEPSGYPRRLFIDDTHLDRDGAALFSEDVATAMARELGTTPIGPRWVNLPAFRPRRNEIPLEDIESSQLALEARRRARK